MLTNELRRAGVSLLLVMLLAFYTRSVPAGEEVEPFDQVKRLGRGVNILGYDPLWKDFEKGRFRERHFKLIHDGGFQTVRINLHALQLLTADNSYKLGDAWLDTLDWAVKNALANNLMVILDLHNYEDIARDPMGFKPRFLAYWRQIAAHFERAPNTVLFEILNEPNGKLTPQLWNEFLREALAIIRVTNPGRTVVVGPPFWNGIDHLQELALPEEDRNLIVTVHYYDPHVFTHQGALWEKETAHISGLKWGSEEEKKRWKTTSPARRNGRSSTGVPSCSASSAPTTKPRWNPGLDTQPASRALRSHWAGRGPTGSSMTISSFMTSTKTGG